MSPTEEYIDVQRLIRELSVEELNRFAEDYFAKLDNHDYLLAKPFNLAEEAPQLLINFSVVVQGLMLCPGLRVLDFGAGSCWTSRFLSQLGCQVVAVDVSATALEIGRELYRRNPTVGNTPAPEFLIFDGYRFDLPDNSVDRIVCLDAFHHVPDTKPIIYEMYRVLREGGIAGFAEPGPEHSRTPAAQREMREFTVIENDIDINKIWGEAKKAGFAEIKLAVYNIPPFHLDLSEFDSFLDGGEVGQRFLRKTREFLRNQRSFFLIKGKPQNRDSRSRAGLAARIEIIGRPRIMSDSVAVKARVTNTGSSDWLPQLAGVGAVYIGCHVLDSAGTELHHSYCWEPLAFRPGALIRPGETVEVEARIPQLPPGKYLFEFDLVSNEVCWFAQVGSTPTRIAVEIV
jgi:SAM-dependent methyltransferase